MTARAYLRNFDKSILWIQSPRENRNRVLISKLSRSIDQELQYATCQANDDRVIFPV
ncbi:MAG: hypothetical protein QOD93_995 [Acetobacteraceae bacterium]|jgi:hypothetical protein|nr:hypothetical protein [Acetobacteraceae bacterium]